MSSPGCSPTVRKETLHTVSLVRPHLGPGTSVLDVGCGEGWVADEIARESAAEVAVVDVVDIRRTHGLPFSLYDGVHLPFPDNRFSAVVCFTMLHHVPSPSLQDRLFAQACRVLRPGGVFAGTDSQSSWRFRLIHLFDTMVVVDPKTLPQRLRAAGLTEVRVDVDQSLRFRAVKPHLEQR